MLELLFQGWLEWLCGITLECWEYFSSALLDIMSLDFAYIKTHVPVVGDISQILLGVGWALLIGNLVFQAIRSMMTGLGFEAEDPKLLFTRTFVFTFLLVASPQICEIGLNMTSTIMTLLDMPDAVNVTLVDESVFGSLSAAWLLVMIFDVIIMFKVFRLLLEIAERYLILFMLTICAPLAFGVGGSRNTSDIFSGWCRMFGSMCVLMVSHVIFFKMLLSVLSTVPSGLDVLPWMILVCAIVKVARKADAIITRIGLNPAITGDGLGGRSFPGMLTYAIARSVGQQAAKAASKSFQSGGKGNAAGTAGKTTGPKNGPAGGGASFGGTAGTTSRGGDTYSQSNQQSAAAQSNSSHTTQTKNSSAKAGGQPPNTGVPLQNTGAAKESPAQAGSLRRSSVAPGIHRGASFVRQPQDGTAGTGSQFSQVAAADAQKHGAANAGQRMGAYNHGVGREDANRAAAFGNTGKASSAAAPDMTQSGRAGIGTIAQSPENSGKSGPMTSGTAGTPQPSRYSAVTSQKINQAGMVNNVHSAEQNSVTVGQPSAASGVAGSANRQPVPPEHRPSSPMSGTGSGQQPNATRFSARPETIPKPAQAYPASTAPKPQTNMAAASDERHGRNGGMDTVANSHRGQPARQERPAASTQVPAKGAGSVSRPGMAGTAAREKTASQTRQTAQNQAVRTKAGSGIIASHGGKKVTSNAPAWQEKEPARTRRTKNGGDRK